MAHPTPDAQLESPSERLGARTWRALRSADAARLCDALCCALLAYGVYVRFVDLSFPPGFSFDEDHFVKNARNYIAGTADWNDHPPLGKLLMIPGILWLGDSGLGWRIHEAVFGVAHVALVVVVGKTLFRDARAGLLAGAFVAADGLFISYSRCALLDIPMNTFMMASLALVLAGRSLWWFAGAGICLGLAVAVKWIAVCIAAVVPIALLRQRRSWLHTAWIGALALAVYVAIHAYALDLSQRRFELAAFVDNQRDLLAHHAGFTTWLNPADSRWYTWPFLSKPIVLHRQWGDDGIIRMMTNLGNPLLWYATTLCFAWTLAQAVRAGMRAMRAGTSVPEYTRAQLLLWGAALALILQWILTNRESYIWHYVGTYSMGLLLLGGALARLSTRRPAWALAFVSLVAAFSLFYTPVWTYGSLTEPELHLRLWFNNWR